MNLPAVLDDLDQRAHRPQLVVLPPLRLDPVPAAVDDDDSRWWLTAAGAITIGGIDHVDMVPGLDELVRWDDDADRWVRL